MPAALVTPASKNTVNANGPAGTTQTNSQKPSIDLNKVAALVNNNKLITEPQALEVLQRKLEERLPKETRFSIDGGVYMNNGKLYFSGGLMGMLNNTIGGGIQSGNAIGAAVPVVYQVAGNIIDVVSGKVNKEEELARRMTLIAVHHMNTEVYHQINGPKAC